MLFIYIQISDLCHFPLSKEFLTFLTRFDGNVFSQFLSVISLSLLKDNSTGYRILGWWVLLSILEDFTPLSSYLVSDEKLVIIPIFAPLCRENFFSSDFFLQIFSLFLIFCNSKVICLVIGGFWHLFFLMFSELFGSVAWYLTLTWNSTSLLFQILLCFSLSYIHIMHTLQLLWLYYSPWIFYSSFIQLLCFLLFSFWGFNWYISNSR